jgi:hypothetical protein
VRVTCRGRRAQHSQPPEWCWFRPVQGRGPGGSSVDRNSGASLVAGRAAAVAIEAARRPRSQETPERRESVAV